MIALYGPTSDIAINFVRGAETSTLYSRTARVNRSQTLDGGTTLTHFGFNAADSDLQLIIQVNSESEYENLASIFETDTTVYLSCKEGFFSGMMQSLSRDENKVSITYMIEEQIQ